MSCTGSGIKLYYQWRKEQKAGMDDEWYFSRYEKYLKRATEECRKKSRKDKRYSHEDNR